MNNRITLYTYASSCVVLGGYCSARKQQGIMQHQGEDIMQRWGGEGVDKEKEREYESKKRENTYRTHQTTQQNSRASTATFIMQLRKQLHDELRVESAAGEVMY